MSVNTPEERHEDLLRFLNTKDNDSALSLVESSPKLRELRNIQLLVQNAHHLSGAQPPSVEQIQFFLLRAAQLAGHGGATQVEVELAQWISHLVGTFQMFQSAEDAEGWYAAIESIGNRLTTPEAQSSLHLLIQGQIYGLLGAATALRYNQSNDDRMLEQAIDLNERALAIGAAAGDTSPEARSNLSLLLESLYRKNGAVAVLERSAALAEEAVNYCRPDGALLDALVMQLAERLSDLYTATGDARYLEHAVRVGRHELHTCELDDPKRTVYQCVAGISLAKLYSATGAAEHLHGALELARDAVRSAHDVAAARDLDEITCKLLNAVYNATGNREFLERAVSLRERSLADAPAGGPARAAALGALAHLLVLMHRASGRRSDLTRAIELYQESIDNVGTDSYMRPALVGNLAMALAEQYKAAGDIADLRRALSLSEEAVLSQDNERRSCTALSNLSNRLVDLYEATNDLALLERAVDLAEQALEMADARGPERPRLLSNLSNRMTEMYSASGNRSYLDRALSLDEAAVATCLAGNPERAVYLLNLSTRLLRMYRATGHRAYLERAVTTAGEAVHAAPAKGEDRPLCLVGLSSALLDLWEETWDDALLERSTSLAEEALDLTSIGSPLRPAWLVAVSNNHYALYTQTRTLEHLHRSVALAEEALEVGSPDGYRHVEYGALLAKRLADQFEATKEPATLVRASKLLTELTADSPETQIYVGSCRATIARLQGDAAGAAAATREILQATTAEQDRLKGDLIKLRDLAGRTEGAVADLAVDLLGANQFDDAIESLERSRTWLRAPKACSPTGSVTTVWVVAGQSELVVLTPGWTPDHRVLGISRAAVRGAVVAAVDAVRSHRPFDAINRLVSLTSEITSVFPEADDLLIVPVGVCSALPFAAGRHSGAGSLIDHCSITVAPSRAWGTSVGRLRPAGRSFGVFHPGTPPLELSADRLAYEASIPEGKVLVSPTAAEALVEFDPNVLVGHFACHGSYDSMNPFDSHLQLADRLTMDDILRRGSCPWLVNLSACETGLSDLSRAEQMISLPTAFLFGGSAHVLATLWSVGNSAATIYNARFYERLQAGRHPAAAHRDAVLGLRSQLADGTAVRTVPVDGTTGADDRAPYSHPFWWAPFTHYGSPFREGETTILSGGSCG